MAQAEELKVQVLVFPELSITAYTCADLFQHSVLQQGALAGLDKIRQATIGKYRGLAFVGLPLVVDSMLFNCAVAVYGGSILGIVPKKFLANYRHFYEKRWFHSAADTRSHSVYVLGRQVSFGIDQLFVASDVEHLIVGVEICEDLWVTKPPSGDLALGGATILANLSASNALVGKGDYRRQLVASQSARCLSAYIYASCGGDESTTDLYFDGHCMIAENGRILAEQLRNQQKSYLTVHDVDVEHLHSDRLVTTSFGDSIALNESKLSYRHTYFKAARPLPNKLIRHIDAHPYVPQDPTTLSERCQEIFNYWVGALVKRLRYTDTAKINIGISGGLNSTLAILVACKAADLLGLPRTCIYAWTMPGYGTTSRTKGIAYKLMEGLGVTIHEVDIRFLCMEMQRLIGHHPFGIDLDLVLAKAIDQYQVLVRTTEDKAILPNMFDLAVAEFGAVLQQLPQGAQDLIFENVQAHMRTNVLMDNGFQLGTGDMSELAVGWCTYNADQNSHYNPFCSTPKTLVKCIVLWLADNVFLEVQDVLKESAGLEMSPELLLPGKGGQIVQKTESILGPVEIRDFVLHEFNRYKSRPKKIFYLGQQAKFDYEYTPEQQSEWLKLFIIRFFRQQYKRSCMPDGLQSGSDGLSPRGDLRMPSDAEPTIWLADLEEILASGKQLSN